MESKRPVRWPIDAIRQSAPSLSALSKRPANASALSESTMARCLSRCRAREPDRWLALRHARPHDPNAKYGIGSGRFVMRHRRAHELSVLESRDNACGDVDA